MNAIDVCTDAMPALDPPQRRAWSIANVMRLGGSVTLVLALAQFLLVGVDTDNDLQRYGLLLLQTGVFTALAFGLQHWLDDAKSARLLLAVALASVIAGFTVLGAMLYAALPLDGDAFLSSTGLLRTANDSGAYPAYAHWQVGSAMQMAIAAAGALFVLLPTARFAFAVLARGSAGTLTLMTIAASGLLLIPLRDPDLVGALASVTTAVIAVAQRRVLADDPGIRTLEGRIARAMPFLPGAIVVARSGLLYEPGVLFVLPLCLLGWAASRAGLRARRGVSRTAPMRYAIGVGSIVATAVVLADVAYGPMGPLVVPLATLFATVATADLRHQVAPTRLVKAIDSIVMLKALPAIGVAGMLTSNPLAGILATLPLLVFAVRTGRVYTSAALALFLAGQLVMSLDDLLAMLTRYGWQSLLGLGLAAIVVASLLERHGGLTGAIDRLGLRLPGIDPARPSPIPRAEPEPDTERDSTGPGEARLGNELSHRAV